MKVIQELVAKGRKFGVLYQLKFKSGKSYIGITTKRNPFDRISGHEKNAARGGRCAVHYAWRKYGRPKVKILAITEPHMLRDSEQKAVAVIKTLSPNGYNMTFGGDSNPMDNPAIRAKHKRKMGGKNSPVRTPEYRAKFMGNNNPMRRPEVVAKFIGKKRPEHSKLLTGRKRPSHSLAVSGRGNGMWGRTHTPEVRARLSVANKGRKHSEEAKAKMSAARKGKPKSPEHRAKLAAILKKNRWPFGPYKRRQVLYDNI